ncbi:MAG: hypothetical protein QME59_05420, partial [Candidatus Hydrothermarchaeota archaeon]|nr:hypothetical protein [Candidatus Hydrothermarchaeota archaeon]
MDELISQKIKIKKVIISKSICDGCEANCKLNTDKELQKFRTEEEVDSWLNYVETLELFDEAEMPNEGMVCLPTYRFNSKDFIGCIVGIKREDKQINFTIWSKGNCSEIELRKKICERTGFDYPYTIEYAAPEYKDFLENIRPDYIGLERWLPPIQIEIWYSLARQIEVERELRMFFELMYQYGEKIEHKHSLVLHKHWINNKSTTSADITSEIDYKVKKKVVWYDMPELSEDISRFNKFSELTKKSPDEIKKEVKQILKAGQRVNAFTSLFSNSNTLAELETFGRKHHDRDKIVSELQKFKDDQKLDGWGPKTLCCVLQQGYGNPLAYPVDTLIKKVSMTAFEMKGNEWEIWSEALKKFRFPGLIEPLLYPGAQNR